MKGLPLFPPVGDYNQRASARNWARYQTDLDIAHWLHRRGELPEYVAEAVIESAADRLANRAWDDDDHNSLNPA